MAVKFEGNAKRSEKRPRYDLIPLEGIEEIAKRFSIGAEKFGDNNWKEGGPEFFQQAVAHAVHHLMLYANGVAGDDDAIGNLGAVAWGMVTLCWWEKTGRVLWITKELKEKKLKEQREKKKHAKHHKHNRRR